MIQLAFLLLALLAPAAARAQFTEGIKIRGRVLYAHNMQPAENVQVELLWRGALKERTYTESRGEFEFILLQQTEYVVRVRQEGYLSLEQAFNLTDDPSLRGPLVTLLLQPDPAKPPKPQPAAAPLSAREMAVPTEARKEFEKGYRGLAERKHPELSVSHFQKAIELHRDYDEAYVQLALAFFEQRQRANALRTLSKAVEIYPQNARAFALLGKVLIDTNQIEPGMQALEEALALDETLWGAHADLGSALLYRKELDRALTHARRAFALNSQVPLTHVLLASVLQERKEYAEAVQVLDECLRQFPDGKLAAELRKQRDEARKLAKDAPPSTVAPQRIRIGGDGPRPLNNVKPKYPEAARKEGIQGTVRLEIVIGTDGAVKEWKAVAGPPALMDAAGEAAQRLRYRPTILNGEAVEVIMVVTFIFDLSG